MCVYVCVCVLIGDDLTRTIFPHHLPVEDPEAVIPFTPACKTDHLFSQTLPFVIQNQDS